MTIITSVILALFLFATGVKADAPYEVYHVSKSSISVVVLRDSIGVLSVSSGQKRGTEFNTYRVVNSTWVADRVIRATETVPVSDFDYRPPMDSPYINGYRYPVLKTDGVYLKIVINPITAESVWVNRTELKAKFVVHEKYFDDLAHLGEFYVDPFFGVPDSTRPVFKEPSLSAKETDVIHSGTFYKVVAQKKDFIQIAVEVWEDSEDHPIRKTIGWIPVHDSSGLLTVWVVHCAN